MAQPIATEKLPACTETGDPINGSHRVVVSAIELISPSDDGLRSTVTLASGAVFLVPLPAVEVSKLLGWEE